jgi:hypothetical protein
VYVLALLGMLAFNFCVIVRCRFDHKYVAANEIEREEFIYRIGLLFIDYVGVLKIEVLCYVAPCQMIVADVKKGAPFETSVITYQSTRCNVRGGLDLQRHRCENLNLYKCVCAISLHLTYE